MKDRDSSAKEVSLCFGVSMSACGRPVKVAGAAPGHRDKSATFRTPGPGRCDFFRGGWHTFVVDGAF